MKTVVKLVIIFLLSFSYLFEVGSFYAENNVKDNTENQSEQVITTAALNLLGASTGAENLSFSSHLQVFKVNLNTLKVNLAKLIVTQRSFIAEFFQYSVYQENIEVLFPKTKLLFPFNYFW